MKKQTPYLVIFIVVFIAACKKLPKETHRGKNMMACYVNGEKWVAKNKIFHKIDLIGSPGGSSTPADPNPVAKYGSSDNTLYLGGYSKNDEQDLLDHIPLFIHIKKFTGVGEYESQSSISAIYGSSKVWAYRTDSINTGTISIKYYTDKVVAGTFSFSANNNQGEIIEITQGRFDIEYTTK